jgi:hypothetical protein
LGIFPLVQLEHPVAVHVIVDDGQTAPLQSTGGIELPQAPLESQGPLQQSVGAEHIFPRPHAGHVPPPQSMSVSIPSFFPSWHGLAPPVPDDVLLVPPDEVLLAPPVPDDVLLAPPVLELDDVVVAPPPPRR